MSDAYERDPRGDGKPDPELASCGCPMQESMQEFEYYKDRNLGDPRLHALLKEIGDLHDRKQADYGTSGDPFANVRSSQEFGVPPWIGALVRMNDKVTRLKMFASRGTLANESARDSMKDIAVYALIALILYEEEESK